MIDTENQKIQEDQYLLPYHYFIRKTSYAGLIYFAYIEKCAKIIGSMENKKVLDTGCGDGYFLKKISQSKNTVYGVDYSQRAIELAKLMSGCENLICDDIVKLDTLADNSFDILTNIAVIEHIKPELVSLTIQSFHRVIKKDGYLMMVIPTPNLKLSPKHFQHFSIGQIKEMLKGFEIKKIYGVNRKSSFYRFLCSLFSNRYFKSEMVFAYIIEPIYNIFYRQCDPEKASLVIVIAKK